MKIEVQNHWRGEISKIRAWLAGFKTGAGKDGMYSIPGEDTLRQIQVAIDAAEVKGTSTSKKVRG